MMPLEALASRGFALYPHDLITRGEAVYVIYKLAQGVETTPTPPIMSEIEIQNKDGAALNEFLQEIMKVPEIIVDEFTALGWAYHVDSDFLADLSVRYDMNCIGVTSFQKKIIYAGDPKSTIHEFGHFYHQVVGFPAAFDAIYNAEHESARKVLGDYATRNAKEYFAEAFDYWVVYRDSPRKLASLQKAVPKACKSRTVNPRSLRSRTMFSPVATGSITGNTVSRISITYFHSFGFS